MWFDIFTSFRFWTTRDIVTVSFFDVVDFQCCLYLFCVVELSTIWSDTFDSCSPLGRFPNTQLNVTRKHVFLNETNYKKYTLIFQAVFTTNVTFPKSSNLFYTSKISKWLLRLVDRMTFVRICLLEYETVDSGMCQIWFELMNTKCWKVHLTNKNNFLLWVCWRRLFAGLKYIQNESQKHYFRCVHCDTNFYNAQINKNSQNKIVCIFY